MQFIKIFVRRLRFWWHITIAYLIRYKLRIISFILFVFISIFLARQVWPKISRANLVTIGYVGSYTLENIPQEPLYLATQSLIAVDKSGHPIPSLASNWTVSEDGKTYVFFLKDNLLWHDSSPVDAKDISIAISNVQIKAINSKAIEFNLPNPIISFPLALDKPVFKAKSFYGTGQFRIVDIDIKDEIVKKISLVPKDKSLPRVDIKFYQTEAQALSALKIGEVRSAQISNVQLFENWPNVDIEKIVDDSKVITIFYNTTDPQLASKDFRQALSHSINKADFDGVDAKSPIAPSSWAYNTGVKRFEYNTGKAKSLLSKENLQSPKITLSYSEDLEELANKIKADWEAIGIKTILKLEKGIPSQFQALLAVNQLTPDPDQYALWHSTQTKTNLTHYKNVKIDKLLEDARTTQDEQKRKELYGDFQKYLVEDAPTTFLYHPYKYKITYKNIKNLIEKLPQ
jgi:peptide/nickel transport system substrate-binding protein